MTKADRRNRSALAGSQAARLVPASGSVDDLIESVSSERRRSIALIPVALDSGSLSGLWVATDRTDYVVIPADASSAERTAIICHELAHMLLGHQPEAREEQLAQLTTLLAPSVDPSVARQFLMRHGYADAVEADAEHLATVLVTQLQRRAHNDALRRDAVSDRLR